MVPGAASNCIFWDTTYRNSSCAYPLKHAQRSLIHGLARKLPWGFAKLDQNSARSGSRRYPHLLDSGMALAHTPPESTNAFGRPSRNARSFVGNWTRPEAMYHVSPRRGMDRHSSSHIATLTRTQNPHHTDLAWLLSCITPLGKLRRMTTWKVVLVYTIGC